MVRRLALAALLFGCGGSPSPDPEINPLEAPPVDSSRVASVAEVAEWEYQRRSRIDLDGDGMAEDVVIAADVMLSASGIPLWEDGHRWAIYVQPSEGEATLLYVVFVPDGFKSTFDRV